VDRQFPTQRLDQGGENIVINGNSHACELTPLTLELLAQSRVAPAYFVVARGGKNASARLLAHCSLRSLRLSRAARDFPTLAAGLFSLITAPPS
jgi:hypothetical protein